MNLDQNFEQIFDQIIEKKINNQEIKKFLLQLNEKNLPIEAFIGAINSLKKRMKSISAPENAIDVCGTGGDKLNTLNISTAVSFVVSACGVPVAKHGNKAISSNSGSADIFFELGIKISEEKEIIEKNFKEKKLCFLFAPLFHESLKSVAEIRKEIAQPTIFNFLGPMLNPANTKFQLIGVSKKDVMEKMAKVISSINKNHKTYFVHGFDGMDEITICDNSYLIHCENGKIFETKIINPQNFGFKKVSLEAIKGGNPEYNAKKILALLEGEKSSYLDIVLLNSAFALQLVEKTKTIEEGIELAKSAIISGKAKMILENLKK